MPTSDEGVLEAGTVIAGCEIVRLLGKGGMGEVYLARHLRLEKLVALKILPPAFVSNAQAVARFQREAKLAAKISHPNVVKIFDVDREGNDHFILMDYVEGSNLADLVKRQGGPLPWKQALRMIQLAARGAAAVHKRGLIHRDIKPANIMLSDDKQILLMDFGLAREVEGSDVTCGRAVLGTPAFMSPEQARAEPLDPRSDVYSLGSTLFYLLTARLPFDGTGNEVMIKLGTGQRPRPAREVNPYVPGPVSLFVSRVLAPHPDGRPAGAEALAAEIKTLLATPDAPSPPHPDTETGSKVKTATAPVPEPDLVPLETMPHRTPFGHWQRYLPWLAAGLAVGIGLVAIVIATRTKSDHGGAATKREPPPPPVEYPGMVRIPAGPVQIGNDENELRLHYRNPKLKETTANVPIDNFLKFTTYPPHREQVAAFWIDKYEVTNAEYAKFVKDTAHPAPKHWEGGSPAEKKLQHPVTGVSYLDATAYAIWAKKKLPNQQQWLRAFRGDKDCFYPWGNEWEPNRAVVWDNNTFDAIAAVTATPNDVSPFGVLNMAGNASEMTRDPVTRNGAEVVFVRGASGSRSDALQCMAASYAWQTTTSSDGWTGFRCVIEEP